MGLFLGAVFSWDFNKDSRWKDIPINPKLKNFGFQYFANIQSPKIIIQSSLFTFLSRNTNSLVILLQRDDVALCKIYKRGGAGKTSEAVDEETGGSIGSWNSLQSSTTVSDRLLH